MIKAMSSTDWKLGGRMLVKYPGLTVIGGLTLAVAIGLGAAWFEVTRQLMNPRLPLPDGQRIVRIDNWDAAKSRIATRSGDFQLWHDQLTSIKELGAGRLFERNLITPDGNAQPAAVAELSASAFPLTRVPPMLGRTLLPADEQIGAADVVVIGYDVWQSRFNGDRAAVGQVVRLGRTSATIVGVMPKGFYFPVRQQVWAPLRLSSALPREGVDVAVFGRLADGVSLETAQAELAAIARRVAPPSLAEQSQVRPLVLKFAAPGPDVSEGPLMRLSNILAWLILAAACANVATLMFARTATRESEIVVRNALGASRARVMSQLIIEALVLCAAAAVVGLMAASFALDIAVARLNTGSTHLPFWFQFDIRPLTILYAGLLALAGAALVAVMPALRATGPRVQKALTSNATGGSIAFGGVWSVMIVLQVGFAALCLPLGMSAALGIVMELRRPAPMPTHEYLTFRPALEQRASMPNVYEKLKERLEREPAVTSVTYGNGLPTLSYPLDQIEARRGDAAPYLVDAQIEGDRVRMASVDIGFFDTFRFPLLSGRAFHRGDVGAENAIIINETMAQTLGGNPLGMRLRVAHAADSIPWYEVVGVVRDIGRETPEKADRIYRPVSLAKLSEPIVAIHVRGDAGSFAPRMRALAAEVEPELRLYELMSLEAVLARGSRSDLQIMTAVIALMMLVLALSGAGLYSLMSVAVTRRTREIGIRLAIGGGPRAVLAALFARATLQVTLGIILANALLPSLMTALGNAEMKWRVVLTLMLISASGMLLVALIACGVPARRALRIQATEAMRYTG
jgi:putative ABC transport system permease protein